MLAFVSEVNCNCFCVFTNGLLSKMLQSWQDNLIYILWRMLDKACFILVLDVLEVLDSDFCILFILLEHSYLPSIQCTGKPRKGQNSTG